MLLGDRREDYREFYRTAWRKRLAGEPLEALEARVAEVIEEHPEYHAALDAPLDHDFDPDRGESNPFLHMGMHISIREQLATDRPAGIRDLYLKLARRAGSSHKAEHRIMACLGEMLWNAQSRGLPPDDKAYLRCVRRAAGSTKRSGKR